jgi:lactate 2-monooxygenase
VVHYGDYQMEIYRAGLDGLLPKLPVDFRGLEAWAHAVMPPELASYVAGGCGNEHTQNINVSAFERWGLIPRMLVGAAERDMSIDLFGMRLPSPIFMSPIGVIGVCAQDGLGDIATAKAARKLRVPMVASTLSNIPLEEVASEFGDTPGFFQLE